MVLGGGSAEGSEADRLGSLSGSNAEAAANSPVWVLSIGLLLIKQAISVPSIIQSLSPPLAGSVQIDQKISDTALIIFKP